MIPDFFRDRPDAEVPEHVQLAESTRVASLQKIKEAGDAVELLPDGSKALVLDTIPNSGPDTFTIRQLTCEDQRPECIEVLAAKRDEDGRATDHCLLRVSANGGIEFDFCHFAETFNFARGSEIPQEVRVGQFYYSVIENKPLPEKEAWAMVNYDRDAGIFQPSGNILV